MKSFSANNKDWIIVDVDKSVNSFQITVKQNILNRQWLPNLEYNNNDLSIWKMIELQDGNYKIIGLISDLTEEQCADVVESDSIGDLILYKNYLAKELSNVFNAVDTAKESFMSLMKSLNIENGLLIEKIG